MQLFACDTCDTVDTLDNSLPDSEKYTCYACRNGGDWHGMFTREKYDRAKHPMVVNRSSGRSHLGDISFS